MAYIEKKLDDAPQLVVDACTVTCWCEKPSGCKECGWTGVQIANRNSARVGYEMLVACIGLMGRAQSAGDKDTVRQVLDWAEKYVSPSLEFHDRAEAAAHLMREAKRGRSLVRAAGHGPEDPLSVDELMRRLGTTDGGNES